MTGVQAAMGLLVVGTLVVAINKSDADRRSIVMGFWTMSIFFLKLSAVGVVISAVLFLVNAI